MEIFKYFWRAQIAENFRKMFLRFGVEELSIKKNNIMKWFDFFVTIDNWGGLIGIYCIIFMILLLLNKSLRNIFKKKRLLLKIIIIFNIIAPLPYQIFIYFHYRNENSAIAKKLFSRNVFSNKLQDYLILNGIIIGSYFLTLLLLKLDEKNKQTQENQKLGK